jgi:hypothetical protein
MTSYVTTAFVTTQTGSAKDVAIAINTKICTIAAAKTIRYVEIVPVGNDWQGLLIYDV